MMNEIYCTKAQFHEYIDKPAASIAAYNKMNIRWYIRLNDRLSKNKHLARKTVRNKQ
jgi:hypothetical protein